MEYSIGQRVRINSYGNLPEAMKTAGISKVCGLDGEIVDKLYSEAKGGYFYKIRMDGSNKPSSVDFIDGSFEAFMDDPIPVDYVHEFEYLENLVIARFYEVYEDGTKVEVARGHGHIIHEGILGVAQASSWALKKIYEKVAEDNQHLI
jgi:hypothetical protein